MTSPNPVKCLNFGANLNFGRGETTLLHTAYKTVEMSISSPLSHGLKAIQHFCKCMVSCAPRCGASMNCSFVSRVRFVIQCNRLTAKLIKPFHEDVHSNIPSFAQQILQLCGIESAERLEQELRSKCTRPPTPPIPQRSADETTRSRTLMNPGSKSLGLHR